MTPQFTQTEIEHAGKLVPRCQGQTTRKTQCQKAAQSGSQFCGQHADQAPEQSAGQSAGFNDIPSLAAVEDAPEPGSLDAINAEIATRAARNAERKVKSEARKERVREGQIAKKGRVVGTMAIKPGDQAISVKGPKRRARKLARQAKARAHASSIDRGAVLAKARAKEARAEHRRKFESGEAKERAARRIERREAGIRAREEAQS